MSEPIPFTVIGGFLGAGKTTLLNRVLEDNDGVRYAVLVNDFGALDIDAGLVAAHEGETIALANGCLCCSIGDSLVETLLDLMARPLRPAHVLVEASGVADPRRIGDIARIDPEFGYDGIIVLVDAAQIREQVASPQVGETVLRQLRAADLLVVNKTDLVDTATLQALTDWLGEIAPDVLCVPARHADLPLKMLLGREVSPRSERPAMAEPDHENRFRRAQLVGLPALSRASLEAFSRALPDSVLRVKGPVSIHGEDRTLLFNRVGRRWNLDPLPSARTGAGASGNANEVVAQATIVFVGTADMPGEETLRATLEQAVDGGGSRRMSS